MQLFLWPSKFLTDRVSCHTTSYLCLTRWSRARKGCCRESKDAATVRKSSRSYYSVLRLTNFRSMATVQSYMQQLRHTMRNPQSLIRATSQLGLLDFSTMMNRIRSVDRKQMIDVSVIGAELLGFFTVGQMIGRMKIVGYHSDKSAGGHH